MKRLYVLFILLVITFSLFPVTAFADSVPPSPYNIDILVNDYSNISRLEIYGFDALGSCQLIHSFLNIDLDSEQKTKIAQERIIYFYNAEGKFKQMQLAVVFKGKSSWEKSNIVDIVEWGDYKYSTSDNTLKEGVITSWIPSSMTVFFGIFVLLLPLLFTILVEWIISLPFKIKPGKYVVIINVITNLVINILILVLFSYVVIDYLVIILILEVFVMAVEYLFYLWKYKQINKMRLLIFTITANLASWLLYWLFNQLIHIF